MTVRLAVLGAGRWGKTLIRAFSSLPQVSVGLVVDPTAEARRWAADFNLPTAAEARAALDDPSFDAVAIAAPAALHAELTIRALHAGKHVFVEKPLCLSTAEGSRLRRAAEAAERVVMVGHLMLYHPAVEGLLQLVREGELGAVRYLHASRLNCGTVRVHENAWWSLAPHDLSMIISLLGELPTRVSARGVALSRSNIEDVVFAHLDFPGGVQASLHVSWLEPEKRRQLTVVGERRTALFDDVAVVEKLRVFDVGAHLRRAERTPTELLEAAPNTRFGSRGRSVEPLQAELAHFIAAVLEGSKPRTGIDEGLKVVRVLEAGQRSLEAGGRAVPVEPA